MIKRRHNSGFTMAEMMMAVALIGILAGVSFIGVVNYMHSMALLERNGIAKEIFVSAQSHLTMAEGQGFYGITTDSKFGNTDGNCYYYIVNSSGDIQDDTMIGAMLPFGSIDETIRASGSYIIRYQKNPARVLDVYYCPKSGNYCKKSGFQGVDYEYIQGLRYKPERGHQLAFNDEDVVIGWYNGDDAPKLPVADIEAPELTIVNSNTLYALISNPSSANLRLIIEGKTSGTSAYVDLPTTTTEVLLDDITKSNGNFYHLNDTAATLAGQTVHFESISTGNPDKPGETQTPHFLPGEDIRVRVMAYQEESLNVAYSPYKTTNTLFASIDMNNKKAKVSSIRHLENLYDSISQFSPAILFDDSSIASFSVEQIADLDWNSFMGDDKIAGTAVYNSVSPTVSGKYMPVNPNYPLAYDGRNHSISNISIEGVSINSEGSYIGGDVGVFGALIAGSSVKNLVILDADIVTKDGNAGALVGTATSTDIENVIVYNSIGTEGYESSESFACTNIRKESGTGAVGGLVGEMIGGSIKNSAASVYVSTSFGDAGGLVGTASGGEIEYCYSGGHTKDAMYSDNKTSGDAKTKGLFNIIGTGSVGGMVGNAGGTKISNSYSTCSAFGGTEGVVGGFIGSGTGDLTNCYATGLVEGATNTTGSFAGIYSGKANNCQYFEIINERENKKDGKTIGFKCLGAVGGAPATGESVGGVPYSGITAFDGPSGSNSATDNYNSFTTNTTVGAAVPYDPTLGKLYQNKYNLKTVAQLGSTALPEGTFVKIHYGDWPAPEIFVINTAS